MTERLTPEEEEEAQQLYRELCADIAVGDTWGIETPAERCRREEWARKQAPELVRERRPEERGLPGGGG